jgi:hypothetical protein
MNSLRDMTEAEILAKSARNRAGRGKPVRASKATPESRQTPAAAIPEKRRGRMNKLETRYARDVLEINKALGEIEDFKFEAVKLRLATGAWFTADFIVWKKGGAVQLHEVKGHWREAARVRIKVAAELYPLFNFYAVRYVGGAWQTEAF